MTYDEMRKLLDEQEWPDIYATVLAFAEHRCRPGEAPKDLVHEVIANVYSVDTTWVPEKEPSLERHLMSRINSKLANERKSWRVQRNVSVETAKGRKAAEAIRDETAYSENAAAASDLLSRRIDLFRERYVGDADVLKLLDLTVAGVDTPAEIREVTRWSAEKVMSTRRRFMRAAASVARDLGGDYEDERALTSAQDDDDDRDRDRDRDEDRYEDSQEAP